MMDQFRRFFAFSRSYNLKENAKNYLRVIFIWCPIVTVLFMFGFGGIENFQFRFWISMTIATTVASFCFFGSWLINYFYSVYRRRRNSAYKKDRLILCGILTSYPFLLPGLYFGFKFAGLFAAATGQEWAAPRFSDYSSGVIFGIMVSGLFSLFEVVRESKQAAEIKFNALENEKLKAQVSALWSPAVLYLGL